MEDTLEQLDQKPAEVPSAVKTLAIFSYIGNGFWGLMILIVMIWAMVALDTLEAAIGAELLVETGALIGALVFVLALCVVPIIGTVKMTQGKKSGFWMYVIANGIWVILNLMSGTTQNMVVGVISVGFIAGFASQLKSLR